MQDLSGEAARAALAVLAASSPFRDTPEPARQALVQTARAVSLRAGQMLFGHGTPGGPMFVVVSGIIEVAVTTADGRKVSLNLLKQGQCFGEVSMIDGLPRTADASALSDTRLMAIDREPFFEVASRFPELGLAMTRLLCERVRWLSDSVEDYAILPLDRRLARRLLILFDRFGGPSASIEIAQTDLADFAGATRESINKLLTTWRNRGILTMGRRSVQLLDKAALELVASTPGP